jgi:NTP pyrophosphatase (non-canonical NTP hydrolase)
VQILEINTIVFEAHQNSVSKGFWDKPQSFPESIALVHSELSEALEDYRAGLEPDKLTYDNNGKPIGIPSELADTIIRICDLAAYYDIDLEKAISKKMQYNKCRPHMHGKII